MEMEGRFFPIEPREAQKKERPVTERVLQDALRAAGFRQARVTANELAWEGAKGTSVVSQFVDLGPAVSAALRHASETKQDPRISEVIVLRALQEKNVGPFADDIKLRHYVNSIPAPLREQANTLVQRAKGETRAPAEHGISDREKAMNLDYLLTVYRAKWLAGGGPTDPNSFAGVPEVTKKWAAGEVETIRSSFTDDPAGEHVVRGAALEMFLSVEMEQQRWFDAEVARVSTFDDYRNGLDLVLEWPADPDLGVVPRLAIDFTTSKNPRGLDDKLAKLKRGTNVNFFRSKIEKTGDAPFEGRIEDIPMVILGLDADVLSEIGAAQLRGEKMTPDHPLRALLLRQAEIQVGMQIRKLAADLVANALDDRPNDPVTRRAVLAYANGMRNDPEFTKDVSRVAEILRSIPAYDMGYFLQDRRAATRFRHLLGIHRRLTEQLASADEQHPDAMRLASKVKLSRRLEQGTGQEASLTKTSPVGEVLR